MIKFLKVLQVFKPWESLIKVNEEFKTGVKIKAVGNVKEKNYCSVEKKSRWNHRELMLILIGWRNWLWQMQEVTRRGNVGRKGQVREIHKMEGATEILFFRQNIDFA